MRIIQHVGNKNATSWSCRAWLALKEKGVSFEERLIDLTLDDRAAKIARLSPSGRLPVLDHEGAIVWDSLAIMEYVNEAFRDGPDLLPADLKERARARSLLAWMHSGFGQLRAGMSYESTFHVKRPPAPAQAHDEAVVVATAWEHELTRSGGPFLVGALSLADLTFVPVIRRLRAYDFPFDRFPKAKSWAETLFARTSVRMLMAETEKLPPFPLERM
jgi:glutathione S-transferase